MDLLTLERKATALEASLKTAGWWLAAMTTLVVIGLVVEYWHEIPQAINDIKKREKVVKSICVLIGALLITVGVAGELIAEFVASKEETDLNGVNDEISSVLGGQAAEARKQAGLAEKSGGEANERAAELEKEAATLRKQAEDERMARVQLEENVAWRRLTKSQKELLASKVRTFRSGANCSFLSGDTEAFSFASDIAEALRMGEWVVIPPSPNVFVMRETPLPTTQSPIEKVDTGVEIKTAPDGLSIAAGRAVADALRSLGFDSTYVPSQESHKEHGIWVTVQHRPLGPQGEAKLRRGTTNLPKKK